MTKLKIAVLTGLISFCLIGSSGYGGFVTLPKAELDAIFSQSSFGLTPIEIRFDPVLTIVNEPLASIDSAADFLGLYSLMPIPSLTARMYFVDDINWCGTFNPSVAGCAPIGNTGGVYYSAIQSNIAAGIFGAELLAHELSHNLGLEHSASGLMAPSLNGQTTLTAMEANTILSSPLIKIDGGERYIQITPIVINVSAVPEPALAIPAAVAYLAVSQTRRRRKFGFSIKEGASR